MLTLRVRIEPIEPMLFGDNRSARTGEGHAVGDQDPSPATLFGVIGARIAYQLGARGERHWQPAQEVLGPFVGDLETPAASQDSAELLGYTLCDATGEPWFSRPLHLRVEQMGESLFALDLLRPAPPDPLSSLPAGWGRLTGTETAEDESETELLVDEALLGEVLTDSVQPARSLAGSAVEREALFSAEPRLGLAMQNATNTAAPGRLFARPYRRFHGQVEAKAGWRGAGFRAWYQVLGLAGHPAGFFDGTGYVGGDRRRARLELEEEAGRPLSALRDLVMDQVGETKGFVVYLLTPLPVPPDGTILLAGRPCIGAAVGRTAFASGWSGAAVKQGPRPLLPLIPAGSVFFFAWGDEQQDEEARRRWIMEHWLQPLDRRYGRTGFGRMLLGVWR
jgi:CRISPR-associated protein (Cas_Cmr3)